MHLEINSNALFARPGSPPPEAFLDYDAVFYIPETDDATSEKELPGTYKDRLEREEGRPD